MILSLTKLRDFANCGDLGADQVEDRREVAAPGEAAHDRRGESVSTEHNLLQ